MDVLFAPRRKLTRFNCLILNMIDNESKITWSTNVMPTLCQLVLCIVWEC